MESDVLASMYAQIVRGVPKEESQYVTDDESSQMWDTVAGEVEAIRAENPQAVFDVPGEIHGTPSMTGDFPGASSTAPSDNEDDGGQQPPKGQEKPPPAEGVPEDEEPTDE